MADLPVLSPVTAPEPTLAAHVTTKNYVDTTRGQSTTNTRTANYTLAFSDAGKTVEMNSSSATTVTVPTNATAAIPLGTVIRVRKIGTGNVTVAGAGGVTIDWVSGFVISARYSAAEIQKRSADQWVGMLLGS